METNLASSLTVRFFVSKKEISGKKFDNKFANFFESQRGHFWAILQLHFLTAIVSIPYCHLKHPFSKKNLFV